MHLNPHADKEEKTGKNDIFLDVNNQSGYVFFSLLFSCVMK